MFRQSLKIKQSLAEHSKDRKRSENEFGRRPYQYAEGSLEGMPNWQNWLDTTKAEKQNSLLFMAVVV